MQCHVSTANLPASQPIQTSSKQLPEMHPFVGALATLFCMKGCCLAVSELCLWCCACRHTNATSCFSGEDPNCNPNLCCCIKVEVVHVTSQAIRRSLPVMSGVDFERLLVITAPTPPRSRKLGPPVASSTPWVPTPGKIYAPPTMYDRSV